MVTRTFLLEEDGLMFNRGWKCFKKGRLDKKCMEKKKRGGGGLVILFETVSMLYLCPFETVVVLKKKGAYQLNKKYVTLFVKTQVI